MQVPPEIVVKGVKMTPLMDTLMVKGITGLEQVCDYIISTRIALEQAQGRRQTGNPYRMRIDIGIPDHAKIIVKHSSKALKKIPDGLAQVQAQQALKDEPEPRTSRIIGRSPLRRRGIREEPLEAFIRRTFASAQRELKNAVEQQRGSVKTSTQREDSAVVEQILREEGFGFLRSMDGEQVYFHKNSVLHNHWNTLKVGTIVRYIPEEGEKGLQATTVEPVDKPGAIEIHDKLHDLPAVSSPRRPKKKALQ